MPKLIWPIFYTLLLSCIIVLPSSSSETDKQPTLAGFYNIPPIPDYFYKSTYKVRSEIKIGIYTSKSTGSAFGVDLTDFGFQGKRYLLTAAHVVLENGRPCDKIEVEIRHPKYKMKMWARAKVMALNRSVDIAIIRLEIEVPNRAKLAQKDNLVRGEAILATGHPSGQGVTVTIGHLSSKNVRDPGFWYQASSAIYYGNSGGPIWDPKRKEVVGILVAGVGSKGLAPNVAFFVSQPSMIKFIKSNKVKKVLQKKKKKKKKKKIRKDVSQKKKKPSPKVKLLPSP